MCKLVLEKNLDLAPSDSFYCDYTHIQLPNNQILSMTRIDVGLMGVCSNCHRHKNYHNKQQKNRSKSKFKTWNTSKTKIQRLKPRT
jgi:hypothetical protein